MANPKGNPNIVEYGKATRFGTERGCNPVEASKKGNESQAVWRSYYEIAKENITVEDQVSQIEVLKRLALNGDIKALELLLKILKEYEDKLSVESNGIEIKVHNVE